MKFVIVIATLLTVSVASYNKAPINFESTDNSATAYSESNFYTSVYSETVASTPATSTQVYTSASVYAADGRSDAEEDDDENEEEDEDDDDECKGELESTSNSKNKDFDESTPSIKELEHATAATYVITPSSAYEEPKYTTSYTAPIDSTPVYETSTTVTPVYEVQNQILPYWLRSSTY